MTVCIVIQSRGIISTGVDVTPNAIAWADISDFTDVGALATTTSESLTGIDTPIVLRASWTTSGDTTQGAWIINGSVRPYSASPVDVTVNNNATVGFEIKFTGSQTTAKAASGTVTVKNQSDSAATLDTFTYYIEQTGSTA